MWDRRRNAPRPALRPALVALVALAGAAGLGPSVAAKWVPKTKTDVDTTPTGAQVFLVTPEGEEPLGITPLKGVRLVRGMISLRFQKEGYEELIETVEIDKRRKSFVFNLVRRVKPATLDFIADAAFHGARIVVDGESAGTLPAAVTVPPGRHQAVIEKEGFDRWERWIDAEEGQRVTFEVVLKPSERLKGSLLASSNPSGAALRLNGAPRGVSPAVLEDLTPGEYMVELFLEGYAPFTEKVQVPEGERIVVDAQLEPLSGPTGELKVLVDVDGATVWIDGVEVGPAPLDREDMTPGRHLVEARAPGHSTASEEVEVRVGEAAVVRLSLKEATRRATGSVRVVANVAGALASLDGGEARPVPLIDDEVSIGTHFVTVTATGHATWKKTVLVEAGQNLEVAAELVQAGWLHVSVKSRKAAEVFLDDELLGPAPLKKEVPTGTYRLTVRREDGKIEESSVAVGIDAPVVFVATFGAGDKKVRHRAMPWSAQPIDRGFGSVEAWAGFPWLLGARISGGIKGGLDLGLNVRSALDALTEFALRGKYLLTRSRAFAISAEAELGFGLGGEERNAMVAAGRALASILISERAAVTARVGASVHSDRTGPDIAGTEHEERDSGFQLRTGLVVEFRVKKYFNGFLMGEIAPMGSARRVLGQGFLGDAAQSTFRAHVGISLLF